MSSQVIRSSTDKVFNLNPHLFTGLIGISINVPQLTLVPENTLLQSNTLLIKIRSFVNDQDHTFLFEISILDKKYVVGGIEKIVEEIFDNIISYPIIKDVGPSAPGIAISGDDTFGIVLQGVIYTFVRRSLSWDFFLFVTRDPKKVESNGETVNQLINNIGVSQQPEIFVISQLLIDDSDIGETLFEVRNKGIIQNYEKFCPKIVSVLKGVGLTAYDKLSYIYKTKNISILGLDFLYNMVGYSMVRYFLSKLLYGKFNIKFLLDKYYKKFIEDLKNSEYKNFVPFFTDPNSEVFNYNKYFLCTI
jgi:hypothetical protein